MFDRPSLETKLTDLPSGAGGSAWGWGRRALGVGAWGRGTPVAVPSKFRSKILFEPNPKFYQKISKVWRLPSDGG